MSDTIKLGKIIDQGSELSRDAAHVAIAPVVATATMFPGQKARLLLGTSTVVTPCPAGQQHDGIIDPFLESAVEPGQFVYLCLIPGTITGLCHVWDAQRFDHPESPTQTEAGRWLYLFAQKWRFDYDSMVREAITKGGCITAVGRDLHSETELEPDDLLKFWKCIEELSGMEFDAEHRSNTVWTCIC